MMPARTWWVGGAVVLVLTGFGLRWLLSRTATPPAIASVRVWEPLSRRVVVEVLNSGKVVGAGRAGMLLLRRAGLDVVYLANADSGLAGRVRNQVLVRRGDTAGVGRAVEALGDAEVIQLSDSTRLVDLTVLLGKRFRVPKGY